jgi:DNA polymerase III subunit gamma/tau
VAFDTKYRPHTYDDVLGQSATVAVLRQFVKEDRGFHQSYVFCGQHGSGKTTLGRILARALLCEDPVDGNPCDQCHSCTTLLAGGTTECFEELDAATKSGKADVLRITEKIAYSTFSGKRTVYLFDEAHRLSKQALDAMLKPMEDCVRASEDKQLVCIFCTTEPEKMRGTIFSRCAPAFSIRSVEPVKIAERLAEICDAEGVPYEKDALISAAEICERHIRDALKTVEGVSMLGGVTMDNLSRYLGLGANDHILDILDGIGSDLPGAQTAAERLASEVSPSTTYERISDAALTAYRVHLGVGSIPHRWKEDRIRALAEKGELLIGIAGSFSNPPHRPSRHTLTLDISMAHHTSMGTSPAPVISVVAPQEASSMHHEPSEVGTVGRKRGEAGAKVTPTGVWLDPRAMGSGSGRGTAHDTAHELPVEVPALNGSLPVPVFRSVLRSHLRGLNGIAGRTRRSDMGGS